MSPDLRIHERDELLRGVVALAYDVRDGSPNPEMRAAVDRIEHVKAIWPAIAAERELAEVTARVEAHAEEAARFESEIHVAPDSEIDVESLVELLRSTYVRKEVAA